MPIKEMDGGGYLITGESIDFYQLLVWRGALKLEAVGMSRRGPSMYSILKKKGYKGTRQQIVDQLTTEIERAIEEAGQ
jgi:hypothetical protein